MGFIRFKRKYISTLLICLSAAYSLSGCLEALDSKEVMVKPVDSITTTVPQTEPPVEETVTEPAVTEPETVIRSDISQVMVRPDSSEDQKYSSLSDFEICYTVEDSCYQIDFLEDKLFESEINTDIRNATEELRKSFDESYEKQAVRAHSAESKKAKGICADIICRNGFLSVLLEYGYYEPYSYTQAGAYSVLLKDKNAVYFDHAVTLNYELTTKNKITDFSQLFYSGTDWKDTVRSAAWDEYSGNVGYLPDEIPELFTIDYVLVKTSEDNYSAVRYNSSSLNLSYCDSMISSHYRSMKGITPLAEDTNYIRYSGFYSETCPECQASILKKRYNRSRFYSDAELGQINAELEKLYEKGFPGTENHDCKSNRASTVPVQQFNPDSNILNICMNLWTASDKLGNIQCFDPVTYDRLGAEAVLGNEWRSYASSDKETPDTSNFEFYNFTSLNYLQSQNVLKADMKGYSPVYGRIISVHADIPGDQANDRYLWH